MTQSSKRERNPAQPSRGRCCETAGATLAPAFFRALSEPTRVGLLMRLVEVGRPVTVTEAAGCCPVDLSVVSRHLAVLREAGIVEASRRGKEVLYQVRYQEVSTVLRRMADALDACCPTRHH